MPRPVPTEQEIATVKAQLRRSYQTNVRENGYWLNRLVRAYQGDGDPSNIETYLETVEALTSEVVFEAANRYIDFSNRVRITLMPERAQRTR